MRNNYQGLIELNPNKHYLNADINFTYYVKEDKIDTLTLYLYKDLMIESLISSDMTSYELSPGIINWSPFVLESKRLIIKLNKTFYKNEAIHLHFVYQGTIELSPFHVNRLDEGFIELGLYSPYFPLTEQLESAIFNFDVILPDDYILINGNKTDNSWKIETHGNDCTIIASNRFKTITKSHINVYYMNENNQDVARQISEESQWVFNYLNDILSKPDYANDFSIVILPREEGGAYCRPNLLVISNLTETSKYHIAFIGHEISHLWWNKAQANSWEDWLNESFAQYSALMIVRNFIGEETFKDIINKYKNCLNDTPVIYQLDRKHEKAHNALYFKGAYILYLLENKIGKNNFINFLKQVHINKVDNTRNLLYLLGKLEGEDVSKELNKHLRSL